MRVPADMRSFEPQEIVLQAEIEVAYSTSALVSSQYCEAEVWITIGPLGKFLVVSGVPQSYGFEDVLMHRNGEMPVQNMTGGPLSTFGIGSEQPIQRFGQAAGDTAIDQVSPIQISALRAAQGSNVRNFPQPIRDEAAKRKLRMVRPARRPEVAEQAGQCLLDLAKGSQARLSARDPSQCQQQKQRLVGRSLATAPPDVKPGQLRIKRILGHVLIRGYLCRRAGESLQLHPDASLRTPASVSRSASVSAGAIGMLYSRAHGKHAAALPITSEYRSGAGFPHSIQT